MPAMGAKSREVIWGGRIGAVKINAEGVRERAMAAAREADRAEAYAWSIRMEGYGGPAQPSPTIGQCPSTADSVASKLSAIAVRPAQACARRFPSTARHADLEATLKCRSCMKGCYEPLVHMIKLTETLEITLSVGSSGRGSVSSKLSFWSAAGTNAARDPLASVTERREVSNGSETQFHSG